MTELDGGDADETDALRRAAALRAIELLERGVDGLDEIDAFERCAALEGYAIRESPETRRIIRYRRDHERQLKWYQEQLDRELGTVPTPAETPHAAAAPPAIELESSVATLDISVVPAPIAR